MTDHRTTNPTSHDIHAPGENPTAVEVADAIRSHREHPAVWGVVHIPAQKARP